MDVVIHVDACDSGTSSKLAARCEQLMTAGLSVTVIVTNEGVGVFKTPFSKHVTRIGQLVANGLLVVLCETSVRTRNTSLEHLAPFCTWTPVGVVEIVRLQKAGASFLSVADSHYA